MRSTVHVDRAIRVRSADVEDVETIELGQLDELDAVRREELTRNTRRFAPRVRFQLVLLTIVVDRLRPRLEGHVLRGLDRIADAEHGQPHALVLDVSATEERTTFSIARCGSGWS